MDDMSKNGVFFEKKSSVYAGLRLGAIYSTLLENDIETYRHPDKREPSVVAATEGSLGVYMTYHIFSWLPPL